MVTHRLNHLNQPPVRAPEVPERSEDLSSTTWPTCLMMTTMVTNHPMMTNLTRISSPRKRRRMTMMMTTMVETKTRMYLLTMYFFSLICLFAYLHTGSLINIYCFLPQELTACK